MATKSAWARLRGVMPEGCGSGLNSGRRLVCKCAGWLALCTALLVLVAVEVPCYATGDATSSNGCSVRRVTTLPGSHRFASDFIVAIAVDPTGNDKDPSPIWGLTADISSDVPRADRAMYISRSIDGGKTWVTVARVNARYFNARIGEGLRNGFLAAPGGAYFVLTTQRGAFQIFPQAETTEPRVVPLSGPRVPSLPPKVVIAKRAGEPVRANALSMTADTKHLIVGYGYFDLAPQLFSYRRMEGGGWEQEERLPDLPTEMDILSMQIDDADPTRPGLLYVGTGDQVYVLNLATRTWKRVEGVGADSAIHGMSLVGGLHLAACWGVYNPVGDGTVKRVTTAKFLLHRFSDEAGSNLRAYGIEVDPSQHTREVVTAISGVYVSADSGSTWRRLNDLPEAEFRTAHFNPDGTVLVSGVAGTFLVNPFSESCTPRLKQRR